MRGEKEVRHATHFRLVAEQVHVDSGRIIFENRLRERTVGKRLAHVRGQFAYVDIVVESAGKVDTGEQVAVGKTFAKGNALDIGRDCREGHGKVNDTRVGHHYTLVGHDTVDRCHVVLHSVSLDIRAVR